MRDLIVSNELKYLGVPAVNNSCALLQMSEDYTCSNACESKLSKPCKSQGKKLYSKAYVERSPRGLKLIERGEHNCLLCAKKYTTWEQYAAAITTQFAVTHVGIGTGSKLRDGTEITVKAILACKRRSCDSLEHHLQRLRS